MNAGTREFSGLVVSSTGLMCLSELVLTQSAAATTRGIAVSRLIRAQDDSPRVSSSGGMRAQGGS